MAEITEEHIDDIVGELGPDDLQNLYTKLFHKSVEIERAEKSAYSNNVEIQARRVLQRWKKINGRKATTTWILTALERCKNKIAKETLEEMWQKEERVEDDDEDENEVMHNNQNLKEQKHTQGPGRPDEHQKVDNRNTFYRKLRCWIYQKLTYQQFLTLLAILFVLVTIGVRVLGQFSSHKYSNTNDNQDDNTIEVQNLEKRQDDRTKFNNLEDEKSQVLNVSKFYFPETRYPHFFVGREKDLSEITHHILNDNISLVSMVGPSAIGKTTLATEVAERMRKVYGYGVAFANLYEIETIELVCEQILLSLGRHHMKQPYLPELQNIQVSSRLLLIVDDVDSILDFYPKDFTHIIVEILKKQQITILTTSKREFESKEAHSVTHQVKPLSPEASSKLLLSITEVPYLYDGSVITDSSIQELTKSHADTIAQATPGIPLLLEIIGYHVKSKLIVPDDFVTENKQILKGIDPSNSTTFYPLLEIMFLKMETITQMRFLNMGLDIKDDNFETQRYVQLVDLGLVKKIISTSKNQVKYDMHSTLQELSSYLGPKYWYKLCKSIAVYHLFLYLLLLVISIVMMILAERFEIRRDFLFVVALWFCGTISVYFGYTIYSGLQECNFIYLSTINGMTIISRWSMFIPFYSGIISLLGLILYFTLKYFIQKYIT